ncbi:MAG TPA: putative metalloprotease CJM1_0395 family protein [Rhodocyclaceae bacterium]|nr:putative metalloprotease CJM1_0395 family protein [Rhodocyclaceae bacterium]
MIGTLPTIGAFSDSYTIRPDTASPRREIGSGAESSRPQDAGTKTSTGQDVRHPSPASKPLSEEDQRQVSELQKRDREVRAHEMAHVAAGGGLVLRGASYSYETGPDGQRYAVGGEVTIDTSEGRTPQETLEKTTRIRAAALAPADPSPQDRKVAAMATQMAMQASVELALQQRETPAGEAPATTADSGRNSGATRGDRMQAAYGAADSSGDERIPATINVFA